MEPPFDKHLFVDCVFAEQVFDERSFGLYPVEQQFALSSPISPPARTLLRQRSEHSHD
ncbi:MAG: hypothetical protein ABIQ73_08150 [Acidimicrobiales bacterium]